MMKRSKTKPGTETPAMLSPARTQDVVKQIPVANLQIRESELLEMGAAMGRLPINIRCSSSNSSNSSSSSSVIVVSTEA